MAALGVVLRLESMLLPLCSFVVEVASATGFASEPEAMLGETNKTLKIPASIEDKIFKRVRLVVLF
ncbi:conserved hypothetical protein [Alteromonas macleodii]